MLIKKRALFSSLRFSVIACLSVLSMLLSPYYAEAKSVNFEGNVGIGTTNPVSTFTVQSTGGAVDTYANTASRAGLSIQSVYPGIGTETRLFAGIGSSLYTWIQAQGSENTARILSLNPYGGNVGIGTTVPISKVDITATETTSGLRLRDILNDGNNSTPYISFGDALNPVSAAIRGVHEAAYGKKGIAFYTSDVSSWGKDIANLTERMRITKEGNVGIGITNPTRLLQIKGVSGQGNQGLEVLSPLGNRIAIIAATGSSNPNDEQGYFEMRDTGAAKIVLNTAGNSYLNGGLVGIGMTPTVKLDVSGAFRNSLATTHSLLGSSGNLTVMVDSAGSLWTADMWLPNGTNTYKLSGNVGIGTANPFTLLNLSKTTAGTDTITGRYLHLGTTENVGAEIWGIGLGFLNAVTTESPGFIGFTQTNGGGHTYGDLFFSTRNTTGATDPPLERMRIKSDGYVGIGITNPTAKLHVAGTSYLNGQITTSLTGAGNRCLHVDASGVVGVMAGDCGTSTGGDNLGNGVASTNITLGSYWLSGDGGNEGVFVKADGNVGIGTTMPTQAKLVVNGGVGIIGANTLKFAADLNYPPYIKGRWVDNDSTGIEIHTFASQVDLPSLVINELGKVGIGMTNPTQALDVTGTFRNTHATTHSLLGTAGSSAVVMADNSGILYTSSASSLLWSGARNNTIWNGDAGAGNVGIGTANPLTKLHIHENSNADTELRIMGQAAYDPRIFLNSEEGTTEGFKLWYDNSVGDTYFDNIYSQAGQTNPAIRFRTNVDGTTNALVNAMTILHNGNVGIGTTAPEAPLSVSANGGVNKRELQFWQEPNSPNYGLRLYGDASDGVFKFYGLVANVETANPILSMNRNGGNVGIGMTNPGLKLEVNGDIGIAIGSGFYFRSTDVNWRMGSDMLVDSGGMLTSNTTQLLVGGGAGQGFQIMGHTASTVPVFEVAGGTGNTYIKGNVGIGTTGPGTLLEIGNIPDSNFLTFSQTANYKHTLSSYMNGTAGGSYLSFNINSATGSTRNNVLVLKGDGNVGIGINPPGTKLDLSGGTNFVKTYNMQATGLGTAGNVVVMADNTGSLYSSTGILWSGSLTGNIWNPNTENVGIGTASPNRKLEVNGGFNLHGGGNYTSYTADGLWGATATPNYLATNTGGRLILGYQDNGSGLYSAAYGFEVHSTDGRPVTGNVIKAIVMKDTDTGGYPFYVNNNGSAYFGGAVSTASVYMAPNSNSPYTSSSWVRAAASSGVFLTNNAISTWAGIRSDNIFEVSGVSTFTGSANFSGGITMVGATSDITLNGNDIKSVDKITANVVDPLYNIKGTNYSTFAASIAGGLKEEYIGRISASDFSKKNGYFETTLDLAKEPTGSDLWVWYNVVEFNDANVEIFLTPRNSFASVYSLITGSKIIIRSDSPADMSMRLVGSRFDWRKWPTKPLDQSEHAGLIIK